MKITSDETPKILLEIESKLRENARDWLVCVRIDKNTYWLKSSDYAAYGLGKLVCKTIEDEFIFEEDLSE